MGVKKYTVQIPGEEHIANWDEKEYSQKKDALFEKYPDAQITELSLVNRDEIDPEGDYEIHVPGQQHVAQWKGTEFAMKGDALYTKYPKAQVYRKTDVSSQMRDEFVRNYEDTQDQLRTGNLTDRDRVEKNDYLDRYRYQYESILESRGTPRQYSIEKPNNNGHVVLDTKGYHQYIDGLGDGRRGMSADRALNEYIPSMDIAEVSKVDPNDVRATGQYQVKIPGERGMSTMSGEELLEIRDILLRDHPDMEVYRVSANINEQRDKDFVAQYEKAQDRASDEKLTEGERQQYADFVEKFSQRYDALKKQFGGELLMREYAGSLHRSKEAASRRPRILDYIIGNAGSNNAEPVYSTRQKLRYYSANGEFPQELKDAGLTAKDVEFHWGGGQSGAGYYTLSPSQAKQVDENKKQVDRYVQMFSPATVVETLPEEDGNVENTNSEKEEHLKGYTSGLKQSLGAAKGQLMVYFGEKMRLLGRLMSHGKYDDILWEDAKNELNRRIESGEPIFRNDQTPTRAQKSVMSKEEYNMEQRKEKANAFINELRQSAIDNGQDPEETVIRLLGGLDLNKNLAHSLTTQGSEIIDDNSKPLDGFAAKLGAMTPMLGTAAVTAGLAYTGNEGAAKAFADVTLAMFAASAAGGSMKQARDAGASNTEVLTAGVASGAIMYGFSQIPFTKFINRMSATSAAKSISGMSTNDAGRELQMLLRDAASRGYLTKETASSMAKQWGEHIVTSTGSFAAMSAASALVPLIYEDPERYPVLANVLNATIEGAEDGLIMGTFMGGISTGANVIRTTSRWAKQGDVYLAEVQSNGDNDVYARYNPQTKSWEPMMGGGQNRIGTAKPSEIGFAEVIDVKQTYAEGRKLLGTSDENGAGLNSAVAIIQTSDGNIFAVNPSVLKVVRKFHYRNAEERAREAYRDSGYDAGEAAQTPEQKTDIRVDNEYQTRKAEKEAAQGGVSEGTQLDVDRANAAMEGRRNAMRTQMEQRIGKPFWTGANGSETVDVVTLADGREVFVTAEDEKGITFVDSEGNNGMADKSTIANRNQSGLNDYLDGKVSEEDTAVEQERMATEQADNVMALIEKVQQDGKVNLSAEENPVWGMVVNINPAADGGITVQVEGEANPRFLNWKQVSSTLNMPFEPKSNEDLVADRLKVDEEVDNYNNNIPVDSDLMVQLEGGDVVAYKFKDAEQVDGDIILHAEDTETGEVVDIFPEMVTNLDALVKGEVAVPDVDGNPVPVSTSEPVEPAAPVFSDPVANELGIDAKFAHTTPSGEVVVDGRMLWNENPELWAEWNDRNPDRGIPTREYLEDKQQKATQEALDALEAYKAEWKGNQDPDVLQTLKAEMDKKTDRKQRIDDLVKKYDEAEKAAELERNQPAPVEEVKPAEPVAPAPVVAENPTPEVTPIQREALETIGTTPERAAMDVAQAKLDDIARRNTPDLPRSRKVELMREKAGVLQEMIDREGSKNTIVSTREDILGQYKKDGGSQDNLEKLEDALNHSVVTNRVRGFSDNGKAYIIADDVVSAEDAHLANKHEEKHIENNRTGAHIEALKTGVSRQQMEDALFNLTRTNFYNGKDAATLADEILANAAEIAEKDGVDAIPEKLGNAGISNGEFINFVQNNIEHGRRISGRDVAVRNPEGVRNASEVGGRQDGTNPSAGSGAMEGRLRAPERGGEADRGGEEVASIREQVREESNTPDENGVTPAQKTDITAAVGGEMEKGPSTKYSVTAIAEGAGLEAIGSDSEGNVVFIGPDGKRFTGKDTITADYLKNLPNTVMGYMMADAKRLGTVTDGSENVIWQRYADMLNAFLQKGLAENGGIDNLASQWQWIAETVYKTVASNSDAQYSYSLDITRVCKKNEAVIKTIAEVQRRLGRGVTPAEIMEIYLASDREGYQVPCPVCYVFSRYIRNGQYATIMINGQRKYGSRLKDPRTLTAEEKEAEINYWKEELAKQQKNNARNKKAITKAKADIQSTLDEIDKLGRRLLLGIDTGEKAEDTMMKIYALDERYRAALQVVSQAGLDGWITNFAIHEVNGKTELYDDSYQGFPEEMALDLRETATVLREYPAIQRYRNSRGAAAGKEITFEANNDLGEVPMMLGVSDLKNAPNYYKLAVEATDPVVREEMLKKARERFTKAHLYAQRQSLRGGQRQWSWSDNIERLSPDVFVNLMQMEMLGGALQSYSKQLEGINLVVRMGDYVNGSLMGKGIGYREVDPSEVVRDGDNLFLKDGDLIISDGVAIMTPVYEKDGKYYTLEFDDVVGVDAYGKDENGHHYKGLFELNHNLDKAGNILVGMDDLHIRVAMADDRVFFIIPWHSSGGSVHVLKQMLNYLRVDVNNFKPTDYTNVQEEKAAMNSKGKINPRLVEFWEAHKNETDFPVGIAGGIPSGKDGKLSSQQIHYKELRDAIFVGIKEDTGKLNKDGKPVYKNVPVEKNPAWMREIMRDEFLSQAYAKVRGTVDDGAMTSTDTKYIYPYEYWDESSTYGTADVNGARYLEYCRRLGYKPKFVGKLDGKPESDFGNFADDKGYWKLLIDRRMYDTRGYFQDLTPVSSEGFSTDLVDPEKTAQEFKVTRVADDAAAKVVADRMLDRESARPGGAATVNYDSNLDEAVKNYNAVLNKKPTAPTAEQREGLRRFLGNLEEDFGDTQAESSDSGLRLSVVNSNQEIFVSNAEKAVSDIKMEKATPEQWLKMIEKGGGLKAGEDKWIGLSDWLKSSDRKSLTKQEVSDFIEQNKIQIEEVHYADAEDLYREPLESLSEEFDQLVQEEADALGVTIDKYRNDNHGIRSKAFDRMVEKYGPQFENGFEINGTELAPVYIENPTMDGGEDLSPDTYEVLDKITGSDKPREINQTRRALTTPGLENNREIALTVPTIEPYHTDNIHFTDAGEGRAIAWARFGDATDADGNKVLVIDEIQSKRHQEGRDQGYVDESPIKEKERRVAEAKARYEKANKDVSEYVDSLRDPINPSDEETLRLIELKTLRDRLFAELRDAQDQRLDGNSIKGVPAAPFEKNWHELAMKRMLRLAAEEGYDYVAWTTGDQQAERYNLVNVVDSVEATKWNEEADTKIVAFQPKTDDEDLIASTINRDGKIIDSDVAEWVGKSLSDVCGKGIAQKIVEAEDEVFFEMGEFRVGGEGMRGFYDDILPRFMNKYGKKWGVKVEDLDIPDIGETGNGLTMHAVPVTAEMKESVMGGQPMFSIHGRDVKYPESVTREQRDEIEKTLTDYTNQEKHQKALDIIAGVNEEIKAKYDAERLRIEEENLAEAKSIKDRLSILGRKRGELYAKDPKSAEFRAVVAEIGELRKRAKELSDKVPSLNLHTQENKDLRDAAIASLFDNTKWRSVAVVPTHIPAVDEVLREKGWNGQSNIALATERGYMGHQAGHHANMTAAENSADMLQNLYEPDTAGFEKGHEDTLLFIRKDPNGFWYTTGVAVDKKIKGDGGLIFVTTYKDKEDPRNRLTRILDLGYPSGTVASSRVSWDFDNHDAKIGINSESARDFAENLQETGGATFSVVADPAKIEELEAGNKVKVYRSMQVIDGKLYPPMSAMVNGELRDPIELGVWEQADEHPELADENGDFLLEKGDGSEPMKVAYAPYIHTRRSPLNEQFSSAYKRPNLVIVESEIPESELTSGYTADRSKKSTGEHDWPSGKISNALANQGDDTRKVILSRWAKPIRIVPNSEVADIIAKKIEGKNLSFPYNVVTPGLREELRKRGVQFDGWQGNKPKNVDEIIAGMQRSDNVIDYLFNGAENIAPAEQPKFSITAEDNEKLFEAAKERFGTTKNIKEAGYVLPDGTMLDFSGRHWTSGDTSWMNGMRQVDHRDISELEFEKDGNTPSGLEVDMPSFIRRGAIRIDSSGSINLATKPTAAQESVLRRLMESGKGYVWVDFGDGNTSDHSVSYDNIRPERIINDIRRYFNEGVKPESRALFSVVSAEQDKEYMDAVQAGDTEKAGKMVLAVAKESMPDTKVVDEDGNPLLMYHGTITAGFTEFKSRDGRNSIGWFTSSKPDADSYAGNPDGKLYDSREKPSEEVLKAGDYRLNEDMVFDSQEDLDEFVNAHPGIKSYMSERELSDAMNEVETDAEEERLQRIKEDSNQIRNDYRKYEREHFVTTTIGDVLNNPDSYVLDDLKRAWYALDSNAAFDDVEDLPLNEQKDALISSLREYVAEDEADTIGISFASRVPRNGEGIKANDTNRRTYAAYINLVNPLVIDARGRHSEFESADIYKAVEEAMADDRYDGVLINNWRVGRYQQLGDVTVPKRSSQIKSADPVTYDDSGNIIPLSERFNDANDDIRFSLRGVIGAQNDADAMANLDVAEEMEKAGKDAKIIWAATGWEKGVDGKWRNEIKDATPKELAKNKRTFKVGDIIDAPELFASYPEMKDYKVTFKKIKGAVGQFMREDKTVAIDPDYGLTYKLTEEQQNEVNKATLDYIRNEGVSSERKALAYKKKLWEETGERTLSDDGLDTILHELQHAIQSIEGFAKGGNINNEKTRIFRDAIDKDPISGSFGFFFCQNNPASKLWKAGRKGATAGIARSISTMSVADQELLRNLSDYLSNCTDSEYLDLIHKGHQLAFEAKQKAPKNYHNLAGEVEARNVSARHDMSEEDRAATPPSETESVPRDEQIVNREKTIQSFEENGLGGVIGEENVEPLMRSVYAAIPKSVKAPIVDKSLAGMDFRKPLNEYLHELAAKGTENDETGLLFAMYDEIRALTGNPDLTDNDIRYMIWKSSGESNGDILSMAEDIAVRNRWNVGKDEPKFSVRKQDLTEAVENAQENLDEKMTNAAEDLAEAKDAAPHLSDVLDPIIHSMSAQKEYDRATVDGIVDFAKQIIKNGGMTGLNTRDFNRMLTVIKSSVGKSPKSVEKYSNELLDKLLDHIVKDERTKFEKLVNIKDVTTNQSGVAAIGSLDVSGQISMRNFRDYMLRPQDEIGLKLAEEEDKFNSEDQKIREDARAAYEGLKLASDYQRDLAENIKEGNELENELDEAKEAKRTGNISAENYREFVKATEAQLRGNKIERVDFYRDFINRLAELQKGSKIRAHTFREANRQRIEDIHHDANRDLEGVPSYAFVKKDRLELFNNSKLIRFPLSSLATFDQVLRLLGRKNPDGEGWLYNRFGRGWIDARNRHIELKEKYYDLIDKKAQEVFGKKYWSQLYDVEREMKEGMTITIFDEGKMHDLDLTVGNMLAIYAWNKQIDGKMKLRRMNISEEDVDRMKNSVDPRFIELIDWVQDELFPQLGVEANEVYERMFGASMPRVENYFPLEINENSRTQVVDLGKDYEGDLSSTITGAFIKRRRNSTALDIINTDALDIVIGHIDEMCDAIAFSEFRRDVNSLLSYRHFKNQIMNMDTIYGSGTVLWKSVKNVAAIAQGKYEPAGRSAETDKLWVGIGKLVTGSKIAFRNVTAFKQTLSLEAFLADSRIDILAKNLAHPKGSWTWCYENLPMFRERWKSRQAGDTRLMVDPEMEWKIWTNKTVQEVGRAGMWMNAFIDALTVSIGAKSVYETRYDHYVNAGYTKKAASRRAKQDATISFNQSQQSSEAMFVSQPQLDRTAETVVLTTYRNSSQGYQRRLHQGLRGYGRLFKKGYREKAIANMIEQKMADGLSEDQAKAAAEKEYNKSMWQFGVAIGVFGFLLELLWNFGIGDVQYLAAGDDDEVKKKIVDRALFHTIAAPIEGLMGGNVVSTAIDTYHATQSTKNIELAKMPIESDIEQIISLLDYDEPAAVAGIARLIFQAGIGFNPQTFTDAVVAALDYFDGNVDNAREFAIFLMRINQFPQSTVEEFMLDEIDMTVGEARQAKIEELAKRYADYKMRKATPLNMWMYNEGLYEKRHKSYEKKFKDKVSDREDLHMDEQETN